MQELNMVEVEEVSGAVTADGTLGGSIAFVGMAIGVAALTVNPVGIALLCGSSLFMSYMTYRLTVKD